MTIQQCSQTTAHNYDAKDKFYTFSELADFCTITGEPLLPACATFIPLPTFDSAANEIPVFIPEENRWEIQPNTFWQPKITTKAISLGHEINGDLSVVQIPPLTQLKYTGVDKVLNRATLTMAMSCRLKYIQQRVIEANNIHIAISPMCSIENLHDFKYITEDVVIHMKRFVDEIFTNEWLLLESHSRKFSDEKIIEVCASNEVSQLRAGTTKSELQRLLSTDAIFFETLTELRNSFSHHIGVASSYQLMGEGFPTVNTAYTKKGNLNEIWIIQVYLEDLIKSFNRFVRAVINN